MCIFFTKRDQPFKKANYCDLPYSICFKSVAFLMIYLVKKNPSLRAAHCTLSLKQDSVPSRNKNIWILWIIPATDSVYLGKVTLSF
jgi:hypothetical protein